MVLLPIDPSIEEIQVVVDERTVAEFDLLYRDEFPRLAGALYAMSGVGSLAEDVAQDAFAHAWSRWARVAASPSPAGWVDTTAFRFLGRRMRSRRAPRPQIGHTGDASERTDERIDLLQALRTLPSSQQQVVVLRHFLRLSTIEVADRLGTTEGAVRSTLHRAVIGLRSALKDPDPEKEEKG